RAFAKFSSRMRAAHPSDAWWRKPGRNAKERAERDAAQRELWAAVQGAAGFDVASLNGEDGRLDFLSPDKRESLRRITQDYDEMMAKFGASGGVQLASDKEKQKLLQSE